MPRAWRVDGVRFSAPLLARGAFLLVSPRGQRTPMKDSVCTIKSAIGKENL